MNNTAREAGRAVAIALTVAVLVLLAAGQWLWAHRQEIRDAAVATYAALVLTAELSYEAGRWSRRQLEALNDQAAELLDSQPVPALAPITAGIEALRRQLEALVSWIYRGLAAA